MAAFVGVACSGSERTPREGNRRAHSRLVSRHVATGAAMVVRWILAALPVQAATAAKIVVLVHGSWPDGSGPEEGGRMAANGVIDKASNHSVEQTVSRLEDLLHARGVKLFVLIDHSAEAKSAGMKMHPTKLLVFGNPSGGTPLMLAAPSVAIDLPLKILVWEDSDGKVWVSYNAREYLKTRHGLPEALLANIAVVEALADEAAK